MPMPAFVTKIRDRILNFRAKGRKLPPAPGTSPIIAMRRGSAINWSQLAKSHVLQNSVMIIVCAYFVADFVATAIRPLIPEAKAPRSFAYSAKKSKQITDYDLILSRNLFNEKGLIPDTDEMNSGFGPPVKTSLPLNLTGLIMVRDELKSVASVEDKGANQVVAVRVNDLINTEAMVQKIEASRLIFFNKRTSRREYIELPQEQILASIRKKSGATAGNGIIKESDNRFTIERQAVDKALQNLPEVLTQARCVPNLENGKPDGYRCFQIVPGSIYEQLGLKENDVICGLNGEPLTDPSKAFAIFEQLKNKSMSSLDICIKRNGRITNSSYDFR
jgi:general secretion pathway protein C